jgi:DNA-binding NarL/FixJ family response regulator
MTPRTANRILIADDHALVRETIAAFLAALGDMDLLTAPTLAGAIDAIAENGPFDLVLLDYNMPGMHGLEGLARAIDANDSRPVALISGVASNEVVAQAIESGAAGFLPKKMSASSLANVVRLMLAGERFVPANWSAHQKAPVLAKDDTPILSGREHDVLTALGPGRSNSEIADVLGVRPATVKHHIKGICRKLRARNRTHAALIAREIGLI